MNIRQIQKQISLGDEKPYREIIRVFQGPLLNFIFNMVHQKEQAEDICQETFIKAFKHLSRFNANGAGTFKTWLFTIGKNTVLDYLRHVKRDPVVAPISIQCLSETAQIPENVPEKFYQMQKKLDALPEDFRLTFELVLVQGFSHKEASETLGVSEGTIKSRLARIKSNLRLTIQS